MLEKSNDKFPYSLILLRKEDSGDVEVIGHSRLCRVHGMADACFVESGNLLSLDGFFLNKGLCFILNCFKCM